MKSHYNKAYFEWQKKAGEYGANQDIWMYEKYTNERDTVLDFGCGGGYMLAKIRAKRKYGVDINSMARKEAEKKGIRVYNGIEELPKNLKFDVVISHHTLEHVENPVDIINQLHLHLRKKGRIICVVPIDDWRRQKKYTPHDINKHLYTWTPLLLGNLFSRSGYKIKKIEVITHMWLPLSRYYYAFIPKRIYHFLAKIYGMIVSCRQIRIIATA